MTDVKPALERKTPPHRLWQYLLNCVPVSEGGPLRELPVAGKWTKQCEAALRRFATHATGNAEASREAEGELMMHLAGFHPLLRLWKGEQTAFVKEVLNPGFVPRRPTIAPGASAFRLKARKTRNRGWGLFAAEEIPARRKVIEYIGLRIDRAEANRRKLRSRLELIAYGPNDIIDPSQGGSGAEFINHSCSPNLAVRRTKGHLLLVSLRTIPIGEELSFDYKLSSSESDQNECRCGSPNCKGTY